MCEICCQICSRASSKKIRWTNPRQPRDSDITNNYQQRKSCLGELWQRNLIPFSHLSDVLRVLRSDTAFYRALITCPWSRRHSSGSAMSRFRVGWNFFCFSILSWTLTPRNKRRPPSPNHIHQTTGERRNGPTFPRVISLAELFGAVSSGMTLTEICVCVGMRVCEIQYTHCDDVISLL